jgi:hypothetical protein
MDDWRKRVRKARFEECRTQLQRYANSLGLDVLVMMDLDKTRFKATEAMDFGKDLYETKESSEMRAFLTGYALGKESC